jgi:methyl-accepting chemotaxis protein
MASIEKGLGTLIILVGLVGLVLSLALVFVVPDMVRTPLKAALDRTASDIDGLATKVDGYGGQISKLSGEFTTSLDGFSAKVVSTSEKNKKSLGDLKTTITGASKTLGDFGSDLGEVSDSMGSIGKKFKDLPLPGAADLGNDFTQSSAIFKRANKNSVSIAAQLETSADLLGESASAFDDLKALSTTVGEIGGTVRSLSGETATTLDAAGGVLKGASTSMRSADASSAGLPFQALGAVFLFIFLVILSIGFNFIEDAKRSESEAGERARLERRIAELEARLAAGAGEGPARKREDKE